ncbi:hypothetical protein [Sorangium sp. So ce204]|uniref:hypothetical protein n=1 Tax=Sorangium sp. So ce204 TaxID=3133288 RepID=UPI003F619462
MNEALLLGEVKEALPSPILPLQAGPISLVQMWIEPQVAGRALHDGHTHSRRRPG